MNTLELLQSLEGCKIVKREDGVIEIIPEVESKEAPRFKDGDFISYTNDDGDKFIFIYDKINQYGYISAYCQIIDGIMTIHSEGKSCFRKDRLSRMRLANDEECLELLEALRQERKLWNNETLQIEEDRAPRIGDKCVFWDEGDEVAFVSKYFGIDAGYKHKHRSVASRYQYCVRFQDYDFETMSPKHEK